MQHVAKYLSPLGNMTIISEDNYLIGLYFDDSKYSNKVLNKDYIYFEDKIILLTKKWLNIYFSGKKPDFCIPFKLIGSDFNKKVWLELLKIPYGTSSTYKEITNRIKDQLQIKNMSCQAIGQAISKNNIIIIIPCHRILSIDNKLKGFSANINRKKYLLDLENIKYNQ